MRIAIIGPTHPYKGGIPQETTELAHRLQAAGHDVKIVSWKAMYPKVLYPGEQFVPGGQPERSLFGNTERRLSWKNPTSWWRQVRKLRTYDQVIFVYWVPTIQGPVYLTMLKALGRGGPKTALICHNVLPHEPRPGDTIITKAVLKRVDRVVTHTDQQAKTARALTTTTVHVSPLPMAMVGKIPTKKTGIKPATLRHHLLFFGIVRKYKGLDVLLRALVQTPKVTLTVAGEFWGAGEYENLITELGIGDRVDLQKGYVPAERLPALFAKCDASVLPYRGGTGSFQVSLAHSYGLPVIGTRASSIVHQVHDDVDGLLCEPDNVDSLAAAIKKFYQPGVAARLRKGVPKVSANKEWQDYLSALGD